MTPLHILIAIHYHTTHDRETDGNPPRDYPGFDLYSSQRAVITEFVHAGLLKVNRPCHENPLAQGRTFFKTPGLAVYVEQLCKVEYPEQVWLPAQKARSVMGHAQWLSDGVELAKNRHARAVVDALNVVEEKSCSRSETKSS